VQPCWDWSRSAARPSPKKPTLTRRFFAAARSGSLAGDFSGLLGYPWHCDTAGDAEQYQAEGYSRIERERALKMLSRHAESHEQLYVGVSQREAVIAEFDAGDSDATAGHGC
jgi:hypothetical protein